MPSIRAHRVSFSFSDSTPILKDATFHLANGWTALVGENGAGKSTLLRILLGEFEADGGSLVLDPEWAFVRLCPQSVEMAGPEIHELAGADDVDSIRLRERLRLDSAEVSRWDSLSPGERKRWQIAAALAAEPDVLLLDEPTNHLDAPGRALLVEALSRFRGIGLVVSHDRELLETLTTRTLRLHRGQATPYPLPYSAARAQWESEQAARLEERQRAQDEARRLERRSREMREASAQAGANRSRSRRMRNRHDSDSRTLAAETRVANAEKKLGRQASTARREAEKVWDGIDAVEMEKQLGRSLFVDWERPPSRWLALIEKNVIAGPAPLSLPGTLGVGRDDRIHIAGVNGAGKTTLVQALLDAWKVDRARVVYLPQELGETEARVLLDECRVLPPKERGRLLSVVAALGVDPDRLLASGQPSPGEARKLLVARGLSQRAWALVLDEPTNHLDLPSIERLEAALAAYPGALVLVTHDDAFASRCTTTRWVVGNGQVETDVPAPTSREGETTTPPTR